MWLPIIPKFNNNYIYILKSLTEPYNLCSDTKIVTPPAR
jgi:hypothetical protein